MLHDLFKQICIEEAKALNEFRASSANRLAELEVKYEDEKLKEKEICEEHFIIHAEINNVLHKDGYNGDAEDVIEYFSRTHLPFTVKNCYFDIQPELKRLYDSLPKPSENLEKFQKEYKKLKIKMSNFKHINEEILINSILAAFQKLIPENNGHDIFIDTSKFTFRYPKYRRFPWNVEVNEDCVDYDLVDWYSTNIDAYLKLPVHLLKHCKREVLFK